MNNTTRFSATIEYLPGHRSAIIELTDSSGEWAGGFRAELPRAASTGRASLYEEGFRAAERAAAVKGGTLDRFSEAGVRPAHTHPPFEAPLGLRVRCETEELVPHRGNPRACGQYIEPALIRRPGNVITMEIGTPLPRCRRKIPQHWTGAGASSLRWLGSGGSPLVFGPCTPGVCPDGGN